ncbi:MAG: YHS domain-containing (seleno)protein [Candidatus Cyclobacteriaceae bacterium M3_2C_046]
MQVFSLKLVLLLALATACYGQKDHYFNQNGVALGGYDVMAYHLEGHPMKGNEQFSLKWEGVTWLFANQEHLEKFKKDAQKFTPQYGGYCAYAVANGYTAKTDPETYDIINQKLYLNYNQNVQETWRAEKVKFINQGNKNWPSVLK